MSQHLNITLLVLHAWGN